MGRPGPLSCGYLGSVYGGKNLFCVSGKIITLFQNRFNALSSSPNRRHPKILKPSTTKKWKATGASWTNATESHRKINPRDQRRVSKRRSLGGLLRLAYANELASMDISSIAARLGLTNSKSLIRKAEELRRLSDVQFDSSIIGVGEVVKAIICLEIAASRLQLIFDRSAAIRLSGMSEKAYVRCFNAMQNGIGVKTRLDVRELAIQFGCVRLISFVQKGLSLYKDRFLAALPASRRANTDFSRPVFTAVAFYLCAKKHKLKVDKCKLIELSGTSESEFLTIMNSMNDLCFDVFGSSKEKKDPQAVKGHRELLDTLPKKRISQDDGDVSDDSSIDIEDDVELPCYKKRKLMEKKEYDEWKSSIISSNQKVNKALTKRSKQTRLNFFEKI